MYDSTTTSVLKSDAAPGQLYSAASQKDNLVAREYSRIAQEQNALTQKSNDLNIKIASSTKKDSIAMMAFTFITALFLPGTYVSSLFSMSMFDWMAGPNGGRLVSARLWIYWVITIPLTAAVMAGWFLWYRAADAAWRRETRLEGDSETEEAKTRKMPGPASSLEYGVGNARPRPTGSNLLSGAHVL